MKRGLMVLVISILLLCSGSVYSQVSDDYVPDIYSDGNKFLTTLRAKYKGTDVSGELYSYNWVDGQETVSGVLCWKVYSSEKGYYDTTGDYQISWETKVGNEIRVYMTESVESGVSYKTTYTPYWLNWRYGLDIGDQWSHDHTVLLTSPDGSTSTSQITETATLVGYEDVTTDYGSYSNALKVETLRIDAGAYYTSSYTLTDWLVQGVTSVMMTNSDMPDMETHLKHEFQSGTPSSGSVPTEEPVISVAASGTSVTISWQAVADATGYTLFFAPLPYAGPNSIGVLDLGNQTSLALDLWDGASFLIAIQAYNSHGGGAFSNVEQFTLNK